jgi:mannose-1-phosphate guanylyltransferase
MILLGYWMDIGQPKDYLSGQRMHLDSLESSQLAQGANIKGSVLIHASAQVDPSAVIGPHVTIGAGCKVGPGARIKDSTLLEGSQVKAYSLLEGSILGWKSSIG